jgi:hypothetical protein
MRNNILFVLLFGSISAVFAQKTPKMPNIKPKDFEKLSVLEDSMANLAAIAVWDTATGKDEIRRKAGEQLNLVFTEALKINGSFGYGFEKLQNVSIQYPTDKSFRVITFQTFINRNEFKYFGYVQYNQTKSKYFVLKDQSASLLTAENEVLNPDKWFGCVYYKLKEFKSQEGMKYLLFGFNAKDDYEKVKLCDVLTLKGNKISFGAPVFVTKPQEFKKQTVTKRLIQIYSAEAAMRFNYDEDMAMIVYDHLMPGTSRNPDIPYVQVPDGTYEAFVFKKGLWEYIEQLPNTPMREAPREMPVLEKKAKVVDKENARKFKFPERNQQN